MTGWKDGLHLIPPHMHDGLERWIERGISMGSFGNAVMENNFLEAFGRADLENQGAMRQWAEFVYSYAPAGCHGSPERVEAWRRHGGLTGLEAKRAKETTDASD